MSKYFDLWVLTRQSNQASIEEWIEYNPRFNNINFIYFDLPYYLRFWKSGLRGVRTYYVVWQWAVNSIIKRIMIQNRIEIFHHLTYGNALWPVSRYGKKQFFIWGPTGGVESVPSELSKHYEVRGRMVEWLRRTVVNTLKYNIGFNNRCKNANLILCKTEILKNTLPVKYQGKAILFTDVAVGSIKDGIINKKNDTNRVDYITVGRLDPWRGFDLLIDAFDLAVKVNPNIHLKIIGNGSDWSRLQNLIMSKNLGENIDMCGKVSMEVYYEEMMKSDVVVNTCLREGSVTTSFDSMAIGIPLICIDTKGHTRYFTNDYAIVIPIQIREELIFSLKNAILELLDKEKRIAMGEHAQEVGKRFTWDSKGAEIYTAISNAYYSSVVDDK
ncbi:glycosyltransferase family 4 protein [Gammaproteobacteria bacterium]|nr:glycosyltransferase family 4 protein [Gammaproteobacteria bacterium]